MTHAMSNAASRLTLTILARWWAAGPRQGKMFLWTTLALLSRMSRNDKPHIAARRL
jgi:hypothetical protein